MTKKKPKPKDNTIAQNKKARFDYHLNEFFEAGLVLEGWEVKSLREGKANLTESYVIIKEQEAWLLGSNITPLLSASTHVNPDPTRTRKLLLHKKELATIFGSIQKKGLTCVPLNLHWYRGRVKCDIALAKGKHLHDKRASQKEKDWNRDKSRILRNQNKS